VSQTSLCAPAKSDPDIPPKDGPASNRTANFDRIARPYRWLEYLSFGPLLQRTRTHWISAVSHCRSALVLGDGDGRFTAALLAANPRIHIHAVDLSPTMLSLLRSRCDASRITTEAADLRSWQPRAGTSYDLITAHFFLDCLTTGEISTLANRLAPALQQEAIWLVTDFAIPHTSYGRFIATPIVQSLYAAFALLTGLGVRKLPDHDTALKRGGWQLQHAHQRAAGLLISQLWKLRKLSKR